LLDQVHDKLRLCFHRGLSLALFSLLPLLAGCLSNSLTSLQVLPATGTVAVGQTSQFQALAGFTKSGHANTTTDVTTQAKWQSSNPAVATINSGGLATGVSVGTAVITASMQGTFGIVTGTSNITVTASTGPSGRILSALTVTPGSQSITATGQTVQLIAIGTYSAAPLTQNLSATATWSSSDVQVAKVNSSGLVAGVGVGQTIVTAFATASDGSVISGTATVTVTAGTSGRILSALTVTPGSQTITATGQTAQLIAIGTYTAAPFTQNLSATATWSSSDVQVASVNSSGLVAGVGVGQTTVTAFATASDGSVISGTAAVTVNTAPSGRILTSLSVIPASQTVTVSGETAQFIAIGTYSAAPLTLDLTNQVAWQSSDVQVGQVNSSGLVTGIGATIAPGSATITALATASDGSVVPASATFSEASPGGSPSLPTLTVYEVGNGTGTVTAGTGISGGMITGTVIITCASGAAPACIGNFPVGTTVYLVATALTGSVFDGWSANCPRYQNNPNACSITMTNNATVGAIFDPMTP
jgi:hypothetical protein